MKTYHYNIRKTTTYKVSLNLKDDDNPQEFEQSAIDMAENSCAIVYSGYETVCIDEKSKIVYQD